MAGIRVYSRVFSLRLGKSANTRILHRYVTDVNCRHVTDVTSFKTPTLGGTGVWSSHAVDSWPARV